MWQKGVSHILGPSLGRQGPNSPHCTLQRHGRRWHHPWGRCALLLLSPWHTPILPMETLQFVHNPMALPHPTHESVLLPHPMPSSTPAAPGLTHHSGGCRRGRTGPQVPSTSPAGDPMGANAMLSPGQGVPVPTPPPGPPTHIAGFLVVVDVMDVPGQAKIGNLHHALCCDQHIAGSQVTVDALPRGTSPPGAVRWWLQLCASPPHTQSHYSPLPHIPWHR